MDANTSTTLLYAALLAAAFLYLFAVLRRGKGGGGGAPLPPGPTGLPLVGSLLSLDPELHVYFARLAGKYGPIFSIRLGSKLGVVITSPSLAREVLREQDLVFSSRDVPDAARSISYGGGYRVPAGCRVFVNVWAIQRDPAVWKDPLEFVPERFLPSGAGGDGYGGSNRRWDFTGNELDYIPFGSGRRICAVHLVRHLLPAAIGVIRPAPGNQFPTSPTEILLR